MSGGGRTRLAVWGAIALLILLAVVHYWTYLTPGERAGVPSPELVALWADAGRFERALWIAAPHQNLGALDEPNRFRPTYECWAIRRESWLPALPRSYARNRDSDGRTEP